MPSRKSRKHAAVAAHDEAQHAWSHSACVLTEGLRAGTPLPALTVWGLVLADGEKAYFDMPANYARFYGTNASYQHTSGFFLGSVPFVVAGAAITAASNHSRRTAAEAAAQAQWREYAPGTRVIVTDRRLMCNVRGRWLSFHYSGITAWYPEPDRWAVACEFGDTEPLMLSGIWAPTLAVFVTAQVHGAHGLDNHPALATVRGDQTGAIRPDSS
jgi:hypothetical protein